MTLFQVLFLALSAIAEPKVILISFDGLGANVYRKAQLPNLNRLKDRGIYTLRARTVMPSLTLAAHASMLTDLSPDHHQVDWNDWKPEKGQISVWSVFSSIRSHGGKSAMVVGKEKFRHFAIAADSFTHANNDVAVADNALRVLKSEQPQFLFLHFADIDGAGHKFGWLSPEQLTSVSAADRELGRILDYLKDSNELSSTTFIISSDHGGRGKNHGSNSDEEMLIPWIASGNKILNPGEIKKSVQTFDTAATILWLLGIPVPQGLDGHSVLP